MRLIAPIRWLALFLAGLVAAQAQTTLYWDTDGATAGLAQGDGSWNAAHWSTSASGNVATGNWVNGSIAGFAADNGVVLSLDSNVTVGGIDLPASHGLDLSGAGVLTISPGADLHNRSAMIFGVVIAGSAGAGATAFTLTNSHSVQFNAANTYTGRTVVNGGNITLGHAQAFGASGTGHETIFLNGGGQFLNFNSSMTLNEGLTFAGYRYISLNNNAEVTLAGPIVLEGGGNMGLWSGDNLSITGDISDTDGAGTFIAYAALSGNNSFEGVLQAGRVTISTFNNAGVSGPLGASGSLQLGYDYEGVATGEVVYTGATATSDRAIKLYGDGTITVANLATTLTLTGVIGNEGSANADASPSLIKDGPGTLVLKSANTYTGDTLLANGTLIVGHNHALGTDSESEVEIGTEDTRYDDDLALLLENGVTLGKYVDVYNENDDGGSTTLGLSGAGSASFTEEVYIQRSIDVHAGAGGTLNFTELVSDGEGGGSITKQGNGTVVFSGGVDLRGGSLDVTEGTVRLAGSVMLASTAHVRSGAKLTGTPSVTFESGSLLVQSGGSIQPGLDGTGTFTTENLSLESGSNLQWQLASLTTTGTPLILLSTSDGNTEISPTANLTVDLSLLAISLRPGYVTPDTFWSSPHSWLVVDFAGPSTESNLLPNTLNPMTVLGGTFSNGTFTTFMDANGDLNLQFTPVPEPSTWVMVGLGSLVVLLPRLRRRF